MLNHSSVPSSETAIAKRRQALLARLRKVRVSLAELRAQVEIRHRRKLRHIYRVLGEQVLNHAPAMIPMLFEKLEKKPRARAEQIWQAQLAKKSTQPLDSAGKEAVPPAPPAD